MKLKIIIYTIMTVAIACPMHAQVAFSQSFIDYLKENYDTFNSPIEILEAFAYHIMSSEDKAAYPQAERYLKAALAAKTALQDLPDINDQIGEAHTFLAVFYEKHMKNYQLAFDNYIKASNYYSGIDDRKTIYKKIIELADKINTPAALKRAELYSKKLQIIEDDERKMNL